MKSFSTAAVAALLAGMTTAQPHGHHNRHQHAKRELVTEWETVWETVTVVVDESATQTVYPAAHTTSGAPGEFFQPPSSTPKPEPQPEPTTVVETPSTSSQAPPTTTTTVAQTTTSSTPPPPPPPPAPTTTSTPAPEPTPVPVPEPSSAEASPAPVATDTSSNVPASGYVYAGPDGFGTSSMDSAKYSGDITYYALGLGACGYDDSGVDQKQNIVAISKTDWYNRGSGTSLGLNMPNHPWCDQTITITAGGKTTTALVHDICPGCEAGAIDVSEAVFDTLFGGLEGGREKASWTFN